MPSASSPSWHSPSPCKPNQKKKENTIPLKLLCLSGSALILADTLLTFDAIKNHNCVESNPLWRPIIHRPALVLTIDIGLCAGMTWGVHKISKKDRELAYALVVAVNVIQGFFLYLQWRVRNEPRS